MSTKPVLAAAAVAFSVIFIAVPPARTQAAGRTLQLPEGPAKAIVQAKCASCHVVNRIFTSAGYTKKGWEALFSSMVALPDDQRELVADYLAKNFPERPRPAAVLVPGDVSVNIREWMVPSLGSRPHEVFAAADGSIWWAGNWGNIVGRLDPKTGTMKEFPVKTQRPAPHSLTEDRDGNIWYTANLSGRIGKLNPKTGEVAEYPMPIITAWDPHTIVIDKGGTLWFTIQRSNMIGRMVPRTGEITLAAPPTPGTLPYGIAIDSRGTPWFAQFAVNTLASIDPKTMVITEYTVPNPASRPRRVAIAADDAIWYTDFSRGYLGRFDPKTQKTSEWPSPSGPKSEPFGIAVVRGDVWFSESATRPNTLVRFNPKTEKFQSWAIPSGGGTVPTMMPTPDGNIAMPSMGMNRVDLVEISKQ